MLEGNGCNNWQGDEWMNGGGTKFMAVSRGLNRHQTDHLSQPAYPSKLVFGFILNDDHALVEAIGNDMTCEVTDAI